MFMQWIKGNKMVNRALYLTHPLTQEIREMTNKNITSYMMCFVAENMMRYYIAKKGVPYSQMDGKIRRHREREKSLKQRWGIECAIRAPFKGTDDADVNYLDSDQMAKVIIDDKGDDDGIAEDVDYQIAMRNALMHTSILTKEAKDKVDKRWYEINDKILIWLKFKRRKT